MVYSSILVIFFLAIASAMAFAREARKKGYEVQKAFRFPLLLGLGIMAANFLAIQIWPAILTPFNTRPEALEGVRLLTDIFLTALFVAAIAKNWRAIKKLPDRKGL